jgi:nucleotide-binding universal stress UspA family protein
MGYLIGTDSVHTTAAACDYLQDRTGPDDAVLAVNVDESGDARDGREALNVASVRLAAADVETAQREGDPAEELLAAADEFGADELVVGARSGAPGSETDLGSTACELLASADRPVVVVPLERL